MLCFVNSYGHSFTVETAGDKGLAFRRLDGEGGTLLIEWSDVPQLLQEIERIAAKHNKPKLLSEMTEEDLRNL